MTEEQIALNKELTVIRQTFIIEHKISCKTCEHLKANGRCGSKILCICLHHVFYSNYKEKKNESTDSKS